MSSTNPTFGIPLRAALPGWLALLAVAALGWLVTLRQATGHGMGGGTTGSLLLFLAMWAAMMAAMMFPSVAPTAVLWSRAIHRETSGIGLVVRTSGFVAGYLLAWTTYGLFAFALLVGMERVSAGHSHGLKWFEAGALAIAGIYQFSPLKNVCLRHCRSPMMLLMRYTAYRGWSRDLRVGLHHGFYCLGCCWGLMLALIAVGVMNPGAMAVLAAVVFLEKLWRYGPQLGKLTGVGLVIAAGVVAAVKM